MKDDDIKAITGLSIEKAKHDIAKLDAEGVEAVRAAEVADQNRDGFIALLDARAKDIADEAGGAKQGNDALPRAAKTGDKPKWQVEDYTGPLTSSQAEWRRHNIKPAKAKTK